MSSFAELVNEAFIQPLRSVLIVDDEYPTWDEILNFQLEEGVQDIKLNSRSISKPWRKNPTPPLKVIKKFRQRNPGFVIDIHDALADNHTEASSEGETAASLANHLHQSDLLVLDYNLEGAESGLGGAKAKEILKSVLSNQHFNLIVIHTGEESLQNVAEESLMSLLGSCASKFSPREVEAINEIQESIDDLDATGDFDNVKFDEVFNRTQYLLSRKLGYKQALSDYMAKRGGPLSPLADFFDGLQLERRQKKSFLLWAINEIEKKFANEFAEEDLKGIVWKIAEDNKWIRTAKGFVCFTEKGPADLLEQLQEAIIDWQPTPSRLLSAKYRHELNLIGVEAEDEALLKHHIFALFYKNIRDGARPDIPEPQREIYRAQQLREHVSRQSEGLSFLIEDNVKAFGEKIIATEIAEGKNYLTHYNVDLADPKNRQKAIAQYNHYVSTLPSRNTSEQLDSGHIFRLDNQWWVCATPACDLQPGQNSIAFNGRSDDLRPFMAFQLYKVNPDDLSHLHINGGAYCFVEDDGKVIALGIKSLSKEKEPSDLKIHWKTFLAQSGGTIIDNKINILQLTLEGASISQIPKEVIVISKLRYAYALNYIQRVGISTSRIGLDYVS
ncbi:MAG: hypothetical protein HWE26_14175 [Alteromonadaceae bacterium]|nr:hypothetical protein [Alteromonadaceae bacterium]